MQQILVEKPYTFIPPYRSTWWSSITQRLDLHGYWLRKDQGVVDYEVRRGDRLRESLDAGHGIMLAPNHCRYADPLVMGWLAKEVGCHVYAMASWHLFQHWFVSWAMRRMGGFSVNREGIDRKAINCAIDILTAAERPLIIFPEGSVTRTNDRLHALLDGVAFIARSAAKKRAKQVDGGKVVVHPVGLKYLFQGDLDAVADPVLTEIEQRFSWHPQRRLPLDERMVKVGGALLCLKEIEFFGQPQRGSLESRLQGLIDRLLGPLEDEWLGQRQSGAVVPRVKALRLKIMPEMVQGTLSAEDREHRWEQLGNIYLAQQVSCYPPDYLVSYKSVDRLLETLERFEEDLTDRVRVHGNLKVVIEVGEPIEVSPQRDRAAVVDPLMSRIQTELEALLAKLSTESAEYIGKNNANPA